MPSISEAFSLAVAHHRAGRLELAEEIYRRILAAEPSHADALHLLGVAAHQRGQHASAVERIEAALRLQPTAAACNNLGEAYRALGKPAEAEACYRRALALNPRHPAACGNLAHLLRDQGQPDLAMACYRQALELRPDDVESWNNLGNLLRAAAQFQEAIACYQRALRLAPGLAEAHNNLGNALLDLGAWEQAAAEYRQAIELKPDYAEAHNNLGAAWYNMGRADLGLACYERALELRPDDASAHSNYLNALQYRPGLTPGELLAAHREYDRRHSLPLREIWFAHPNSRDPERPLRLGFLSPAFGWHPAAWFLIPVLEHLDRQQASIVCYSDRVVKDEMTARFQAAATEWRDVHYSSHSALAEQIRNDRIDILFDLAGHAGPNRLLTFARKPAPIQITWLDYEGTTGLSAIDYLLADAREIPPGAERWYVEQVLRLPDVYVCYDPPADAPDVGPLPALSADRFTFGSFNLPAKITPQVAEVWSQILRRVPRSRLLLKYRGLENASVAAYFHQLFAAQGIEPERVELRGWSAHREMLAAYHEVDLGLDPFPYNGGVTTCAALWMGVPVVSFPGETFAGRHGLAHLSAVGAKETLARDLHDYVELAVNWAHDLPRLAELRAELRQRVAQSPLCDGRRCAENLLQLLRDVWRRWVAAANSPANP
jgi:predicted O-linked N-acetylglucosamine transferase (SPINDLY family)